MPSLCWKQFLLLLAVLGGGMWLLYLVDDGLGISWPQNVVRNWQQFGFLNLHGQLAENPGGNNIHTAPDIYAGMSPLCLWPAYFLTVIFGWTGCGTMAFHLFLAVAVFWAVWELMGRDHFAFLIAAVAILTPGYDRWQKGLDPNAISVLLGLPYAAMVIFMLKKPSLKLGAKLGLGVLTLLFVSLNWTTAWVMGPLALLLMGLPQINRRSLIVFIGLAATVSVLFVVGSALDKSRGGHQDPGHLSLFLRGYLWGDVGYGAGLTTSKAFVLLSFTNLVGLFTLWLLAAGTFFANAPRAGRLPWLSLAPALMAAADIVIMRNYFGHHPWMGSPVLLVGIIFSLVLLRGRTGSHLAQSFKSPVPLPINRLALLCLVCFLYGFAVLLFFRANETNQLALFNLIRHQTNRSATIVIIKELDPQLAQMASRFDELFDRRIVLVDKLTDVPGVDGQPVILSGTTTSLLKPFAHTGSADSASQTFLHKVSDWFNRSIARRKPGDRLELGDSYILYEPKP